MRRLVGSFFALALPLALACDRPAAADGLPEWKPADHHSSDDERASQGPGPRARGPQTSPASRDAAAGSELAELVVLAWRQQCVKCHGMLGRGDGPMGPMVRAHDLADPAWQARASDADIAGIIQNGKDKMPRFDLPEPVVQGLVALVRRLKEQP